MEKKSREDMHQKVLCQTQNVHIKFHGWVNLLNQRHGGFLHSKAKKYDV